MIKYIPRFIVTSQQYLDLNARVDCDQDGTMGCAPTLICGVNNCGDFHELGEATGMNEASDCCGEHCILLPHQSLIKGSSLGIVMPAQIMHNIIYFC